MSEQVIEFTEDDFVKTTKPFDHLAQIADRREREVKTNQFKKIARHYGIKADTFESCLSEAISRYNAETKTDVCQVTKFTGQQFPLKCAGYYCNDTGIWKESAYGPVRILMHPIMPVARIEDYETHEHKTAIAFRIGSKWNTQIVSRDVLSSRAAFTKQMSLADAFVTSENCAGVITFLADIESANIDMLPRAHSASRLGWHKDKFLPFEKDLLFDGDVRLRSIYDSIEAHGSEDAWYEVARNVRANNWVIERCALAAAFASVLLQPLKGTSFFVHIWADVSGTGKTVAMMLGGSVWGNPRIGKYCQRMNATNVGIEMVAGFLGDFPVCMDELCTRDRHDGIEDLVYNYCLNGGRLRGSRNGGIQRMQSWCNCAITTGETPIISDRSRAGMVNRVLELEANSKLFGGKAKSTVAVLNENYGFAGKKFIAALQQPGAWDEVKRYRDEYEAELSGYASEKQFISMAILLAADRFAAEHVFHDDNYLRTDDVKYLLKTDEQVDTNRRAYEWLMGTIAENNARFEPTDEHYNGPIWGKLDERGGDDTVACIIRSRFNAILKDQGFNDRSFLKWAKRAGVIELDNEGNATKNVRLASLGSTGTRCVCIHMNALEKKAQKGFIQVDLKDEEKPW